MRVELISIVAVGMAQHELQRAVEKVQQSPGKELEAGFLYCLRQL